MRIRVLGQLEVTHGAATFGAGDLPRRARQVLAVLAARYDRIQSKDALADAVWGAELPGNHVAALEHYVSVIRRRLQPHGSAATWFIVTRGGGYLFDTSRAALDLAELRSRIRRLDALPPDSPERLAVHEEILELARELPFPEDPYADWAESARNEVQVAAVTARLELAGATLAQDGARSLRLAQEAIELNPYLEPAYRAAMAAAMAINRPDDALRFFERCRRLLDEELGVGPSMDLVRLQRQGLASRHQEPSEPGAPLAKPQPQEQFLGRSAAIRVVLEPEQPKVVHIVGPAGSGKTAFLAELGRHLIGRVGVGNAGSSVGVQRLAWLRAALVQLGAKPEALAVVDAAAPDQPIGRDGLELIGTTFAGADPVFLAVDDADGLDAASVAELAWLAEQHPALRIVLTYPYPSKIDGSPVAGLGTPVVLRLAPLTEQELAPFGDDTVFARTGGVPALVAAARRPREIALGVAMQIARRRTRWMPGTAWEVLRLCAVLGALGAGELVRLTGRPVTEVLVSIDHLMHAHLLGEEPDGLVAHRSSMIREAVAEQVSGASRLHLRQQLAAAS